jgi:hypothetical protein
MPVFESTPERVGTFITDTVGNVIREGLAKNWPSTTIEVIPVTREGKEMYDIIVKTDPITVCEMQAFAKGFFAGWNAKD